MIRGIGTDIVDVDRMRDKLSRESGFREFVFSAGEIRYCEAQAFPGRHYAGRFAAKEALLKALGTGLAAGVPLAALEVVVEPSGRPAFYLDGRTIDRLFGEASVTLHLSIAHERDWAIAYVIIEDKA